MRERRLFPGAMYGHRNRGVWLLAWLLRQVGQSAAEKREQDKESRLEIFTDEL